MGKFPLFFRKRYYFSTGMFYRLPNGIKTIYIRTIVVYRGQQTGTTRRPSSAVLRAGFQG